MHELLARMFGRKVVVIFGQAPLTRVLNDLPAEGALFCADDEPAVLKGLECPDRRGLADVQILAGLANAIGNAAVVSSVVPS